jgi:phosphate starvation-inducible PhoH-like protein
MSKNARRERIMQRRKVRREERRRPQSDQTFSRDTSPTDYTPPRATQPLSPRSEVQWHYMTAIRESELTFGVGPAGTGKTYVCGALAAEALMNGEASRIIITRPAVESGERFGALPGELEEKYAPYLTPFRDVLDERLGRSHVSYLLKGGRIEAAPLAFMRGRTFRDSWVILDEAQNTTPGQMKMFLTRIGENCTVIVNGDERQKDIPGKSGLTDALERLSTLHRVRVIRFEREDVVRSGLVQDIVERYESD